MLNLDVIIFKLVLINERPLGQLVVSTVVDYCKTATNFEMKSAYKLYLASLLIRIQAKSRATKTDLSIYSRY